MDVPIRLRRERFEARGLGAAILNFEVVEVRSGPVDSVHHGPWRPLWHQSLRHSD